MSSDCHANAVSSVTVTEKPEHYQYLEGFRVYKCPLFGLLKCNQIEPFTCFHWHFMNQRRRRSVRKEDGTFNYSWKDYCTKYNEMTGICPNGEDCTLLHRNFNDTERRFHLRNYKIVKCKHETVREGYCAKYGGKCSNAHGDLDVRKPVYDALELQAIKNLEEGANVTSGLNGSDKERNVLSAYSKLQFTKYLLTNYKTEQCKKPPNSCRPLALCPYFHNSRERRRNPEKFKYLSTACPNVKDDEWGDPENCEKSDNCINCHTRNEQFYHEKVYKSFPCNDLYQIGYCPKERFSTFDHVDEEGLAVRDLVPDSTADLAAVLSSASFSTTVPTNSNKNQPTSGEDNQKEEQGTSGESAQASASTTKSNCLTESRPHTHTQYDHFVPSSHPFPNAIWRTISCGSSTKHTGEPKPRYNKAPGSEREGRAASLRQQLQAVDDDSALGIDKTRKKHSAFLSGDINLGHISSCGVTSAKTLSPLAKPFFPATSIAESIVGNVLNKTEHGIGKAVATCYGHSSYFSDSEFGNIYGYGNPQNKPFRRMTAQQSLAPSVVSFNSMGSSSLSDIQRPRDETAGTRVETKARNDGIWQSESMFQTYKVGKHKGEDFSRRERLAQEQRDEAVANVNELQNKLYATSEEPCLHTLNRIFELDALPLTKLKELQNRLKEDLKKLDNAIFKQSTSSCMTCGKLFRSVTVIPCNHFVLCNKCAPLQKNCPYCHKEIISFTYE